MRKFWRIFGHEYLRHVLRKRFLIGLLSVPVTLLVGFILIVIATAMSFNRDPVGYIDQSGILKVSSLPEAYQGLIHYEFQVFEDESAAREALAKEEIQAFFVLPENYLEDGEVFMFYLNEPTSSVEEQFKNLIRLNLLEGQPEEVVQQVMRGPRLVTQSIREADQSESSLMKMMYRMMMPWAVSGFLLISIMTTSGYLMQSMVDEKENRMMEILVTSTRPEFIMYAKILALILVGLTQVFAWGAAPAAGVLVLSRVPSIANSLTLDWKTLVYILVTTLPTFVIFAALIAAIGASIAEAGQGQMLTGILSLFLYLPYMASVAIMNQPDGVIAMVLTYFPLTASITLLLRMGMATIPDWQILLSAVSVVLSAVGSVWLAGWIFRLGMLRYGKPLSVYEMALDRLPPAGRLRIRRWVDHSRSWTRHLPAGRPWRKKGAA